MEIGYFPGCSLEGASKEFDLSVRKVCDLLDVRLVEIEDWNCCGTSPAHASSDDLTYLLPYENIRKMETQGITELLVPCPSCLTSLKYTEEQYRADEVVKKRLIEVTGYTYAGRITMFHLLDFLRDRITFATLAGRVTKPLSGLKIAPYYGCLMRFHSINIDDNERPVVMHRLIEALGGEAVEWTHKADCCGAGLSLTRPDITRRLLRELLDSARHAGADCIAVVCPLCQTNLDMRQGELKDGGGRPYNLPVIYVTQLMGIALGASATDVALAKLMVDPMPLLKQKNLI
ncbi:MAG: CoB--CoM heterodisulfide reductase iron-sulfur subunit B family protein [Syntrophales bacterium]